MHLKTKEIKEIDELVQAYMLAKDKDLNMANVLKAHVILTKSILIKRERGKLRTAQLGVRSEGHLIYLAIEPEFVKERIEKLFKDIELLLAEDLTIEETFYFATYIHLVFVYIYPFIDGNGRATRLVEK